MQGSTNNNFRIIIIKIFIIANGLFLPLHAQSTVSEEKIKETIYLNLIHYSASKVSDADALSIFEDRAHNGFYATEIPYFQEISYHPNCIKDVLLKKSIEANMDFFNKNGALYEYNLSTDFDCFSAQNKLNGKCNVESFTPDNLNYKENGKLFPIGIYSTGLVFIESETQKIFFVSGYLHKSSIHSVFDTSEISLTDLIRFRYFNYLPKEITVKGNKKITFKSEYIILDNVIFKIEFGKDYKTEKLSYEVIAP